MRPLTKDYFDGSPRKAECYLGVGRKTAVLGLRELETGFVCVENFHERGRKKQKKNSAILKMISVKLRMLRGRRIRSFRQT
ncbi:transposase [Desulfonema ishimotonii]|uniref:Transposase n=1 Tax=Desulfonema ishimotonii TaxID=45657 RepID=A0A401FVG0_9BACT|nr:transposase [Desulfonema ishimotonii]